jgi:hypothetical protein
MDNAFVTFRRLPQPAAVARSAAALPEVRPIGPNELGWLLLTADERTLLRSGFAAILSGLAAVVGTGQVALGELALVAVAVLAMIAAPVEDDPAETYGGSPELFVLARDVTRKLRSLTTFVVMLIAICIFHLVAMLTG